MSLSPCPSCARHVRSASNECPFCRAALVPVVRSAPNLPRLGRAAILAFGATVASTACCPPAAEPTTRAADGTSGGDHTDPADGSGTAGGPTTPPPDDGGGVVALYGAPAPR